MKTAKSRLSTIQSSSYDEKYIQSASEQQRGPKSLRDVENNQPPVQAPFWLISMLPAVQMQFEKYAEACGDASVMADHTAAEPLYKLVGKEICFLSVLYRGPPSRLAEGGERLSWLRRRLGPGCICAGEPAQGSCAPRRG